MKAKDVFIKHYKKDVMIPFALILLIVKSLIQNIDFCIKDHDIIIGAIRGRKENIKYNQ